MLRKITKGASRAESSHSSEPGLIEVIIDGLDPDMDPLEALSELEETVQEDAAVQLAHVLDYTDEASLDPLSKTGEFSGFTKAITAAFARVGQLAVEKGESSGNWRWTACPSDTGVSKSGDNEPYDTVWTWINFQAVDDSVGSRFSQGIKRDLPMTRDWAHGRPLSIVARQEAMKIVPKDLHDNS